MSDEYGEWHTGQQIRDHQLATSIINRHTAEGNFVFDDEQLQILKRFCESPTTSTRDAILAENGLSDEPGTQPGETAAHRGSLTGFVIARYGTDDPAFDDRDIALLREWFAKGMPIGERVSR